MSVELIAVGRLSVATLDWQRSDGSSACTLICKATFRLEPGLSPLASQPTEPFVTNRYWNDDHRSSLRQATDLVPGKKRADVILVGDTVAPSGKPEHAWTARLAIGTLDKSIDVYGDRYWHADGSLQNGPAVDRMPLYWEKSPGGPGSDNPPGWHPATAADNRGIKRAPNLQRHGSGPPRPHQLLAPAGYGPIAPHWPERAAHLRNQQAHWSHDSWHTSPLSADLDWAYFNAAPRDQQLTSFNGQEPLILENLIEGHPRLTTRLEPIQPYIGIDRGSGREALPLVCDTLWIDTRAACCMLVWRTTVSLSSPSQPLVAIAAEDATRAALLLDGAGSTVAADMRTPVVEPYPLARGQDNPAAPPESIDLEDIRDLASEEVPWSHSLEQTVEIGELSAHAGLGFFALSSAELPLPLTDYPLERCAIIAAALHCRPAERAQVLDEHQLDDALYQRLQSHYESEIEAAIGRGKLSLLHAQDRAYVSQLEAERGMITIDEYARLRVAVERGQDSAAMREMKLPQPSLMPIERVWLNKTTDNMSLAERVDEAIEAARER